MRAPSTAAVEVYCQRCSVSYPVGTRRCLHCGGPLTRERHTAPEIELAGGNDLAFEDEMPQRSGFSPLTLLWIGLLLAGYLARSCVG